MRSRWQVLFFLWCCQWRSLSGQAHNVMVYPGSTSEPEDPDPTVAQEAVPLNHSDVFQATTDWQPIRPGQVVPGGLHYRMNLATGTKEAKLLTPQAESVARIDDAQGVEGSKAPPTPLRTYAELQDILAEHKLKMNTEFEQVDLLIQTYDNSSAEDRLRILDDLEFLLHQYDNARDFVHIGGLDRIIKPALASPETSIRSQAALILAAAAQSHLLVQEHLHRHSWMEFLLEQVRGEREVSNSIALIHALSCYIRGHEASFEAFIKHSGFAILTPKLQETSDLKLKLKILTLYADLNRHQYVSNLDVCHEIVALCGHLLSAERLDVIDRVIDIVSVFQKPCAPTFANLIPQFRRVRTELMARNVAEELEMDSTIESMDTLIAQLEALSPHSEL